MIDWKEVGFAAGMGGLGGGVGSLWTTRYGAKALTRVTGKEWSHFIPRSVVDKSFPKWAREAANKRGGWNGRWVRPDQHYRHDPYRYPRGWRQMPDRYEKGWQQGLDRTPEWARGVATGIVAGISGGEVDGQ